MLKHFLRARLALAAALLAGLSANVAAHEVPGSITIQAWLKPEGQHVRLLVRVPLAAMRDMNYPTRGDRAEGILDVGRADSVLRDAATLWVGESIDLYEWETRLPPPTLVRVRASLPSDRSFGASYEEALSHLAGPRLPDDTDLAWSEGLLDIQYDYPIQSAGSRLSIDSRLDRLGLRTITVLRLVLPDGTVRPFEFFGRAGFVRLDPSWYQAVQRFVRVGFAHLLDGVDYLLFLFCLVLPIRRLRSLAVVVAAFAAAHSITLIASAYGMAPDALWFPPLVDTLIAISIVYMAFENILGAARRSGGDADLPAESPSALERRWMAAFGFGLVYGFGFSFSLRQALQFAGSHRLASVLAFNIGIELGQLLVLALLVPTLGVIFRFALAPRLGTIILAAIVGHSAWHWSIQRWSVLVQYRFEWPAFDLAFWAGAMRWAMVAVALAGVYWLLGLTRRRPAERTSRAL